MKAIRKTILPLFAVLFLAAILPAGCAAPEIKATEAHKKGLEPLTEDGYFVPQKPVDRHYIGYAWSRQFGPVEDATAPDIRVKKERSLNNVLQEQAYNRGISLGGESTLGLSASIVAQSGGEALSKLSGLEIISAVSLADIPFEPNVPYITEALRLANFRIKEEKETKAGVGVALKGAPNKEEKGTKAGVGLALKGVPNKEEKETKAGVGVALKGVPGAGTLSAETGGLGRAASEGDGLVVAYKLHLIDMGTYQKRDSGGIPLALEKTVDLTGSDLIVNARLRIIEPGSGKSLPRNLLWACPRADAVSRDMVAAWLVDIRSTEPSRKSLTVAFPAYPRIDDCQHYGGTILARIDPATDRIVRQRIRLTLLDAELNDALKPKTFDARVSLLEESFNIRLVRPGDLEGRSR